MMKKTALYILIFWAFILSANAQQALTELPIGDFVSVKSADSSVIIKSKNAWLKITALAPNIVRVQANKNALNSDNSIAVIQQKNTAFKSFRELAKSIIITTDSLTITISKYPIRVNFYQPGGDFISGDHAGFGISWLNDKVYDYRFMGKTEHFIGLGEKTGNLDRRGAVYKSSRDLQKDPLYQNIPFYIGAYNEHTYGLFFDNTFHTEFDFGAANDNKFMSMAADAGELNYYFFGSQSVNQIIKDYTWLTGRMPMPALWTLGYQQSQWQNISDTTALSIAQKTRNKKIPTDAIYLNINTHHDFELRNEDSQKTKKIIDSLKNWNFHVVTAIGPAVKIEKGYEVYEKGLKNKYFASYPNGETYTGISAAGRSNYPDFLRKEVRKWWGENFKSLCDIGIEGFWNETNSANTEAQVIPDLIQFGENDHKKFNIESKNIYGLAMAKATAMGVKNILPQERPLVMSSSNYAGIQRYSSVELENRVSQEDPILLAQRQINSMGVSGVAMLDMNLGNINNPYLLLRWNALGVYMPLYKNNALREGNAKELWRHDATYQNILKKDIELRYRLLPYLYTQVYESSTTGLPLAKSLAINYTWDEQVFNPKYQNEFLFGTDILVCPTATMDWNTEVYLPKGAWYRLSTDSLYEGNKAFITKSPLQDLPVYVKAGAIIPMQNVVQSTQDEGDNILQIHIWKGRQTHQTLYYEDDGKSTDYQKGEYYKRNITVNFDTNELVLSKVEGGYASKYDKIELILHGFDNKNIGNLPSHVANPSTVINTTGLASFTSAKILENTKEEIRLRF